MTIKQQGGIFGRNPTFNDVDVDSNISISGDATITGKLGIGGTNSILGFYAEKDNGSGYVGGFRSNNSSPFLTVQTTGGITNLQGINAAFTATANIGLQPSGGHIKMGAGNFIMTSGYGIDFSATAGTGTSELFSDYEEGTYVPALGSSVATTLSTGLYTKIGNRCFFTADFTVGTTGNTGAAYISLPFATTASTASSAGGQINWTDYGAATYSYILTSNNRFYFRSVTGGSLTYANISGKQFRISGNFEVA
tara:strand:- start:1525 stop:2280 length:756 start_codon:yes stop_codon:yes gene_type:complete